MTFYAERQGFQALDKEPGGNGGNGCAGIAEDLGADAGDKACARYVSSKIDAVVGSVGVGKMGISFRLVPVEFAVFNDGAAQGGSMAADEFGGGMDDYVKAMFQRTEEVRGGKGIVDEHRQMMGMGNVADGVKVGDIDGRVAQGFDVHSLCLFCDGCFDFFRMVRIYEFGMNAQLRKGIGEEFIGAAVEGGSGNDFIAGAGNVQNGVGHSRSAAGYCQACGASFQGCQSLFQYVLSGVCKTSVNEAGLPKGKEVFPFLCVVEYVGSGLVNRNSSGSCGGIRYLSCMLLKGFKTIFLVCHNNCLRIYFIGYFSVKL